MLLPGVDEPSRFASEILDGHCGRGTRADLWSRRFGAGQHANEGTDARSRQHAGDLIDHGGEVFGDHAPKKPRPVVANVSVISARSR
jgi:hypothetical protein